MSGNSQKKSKTQKKNDMMHSKANVIDEGRLTQAIVNAYQVIEKKKKEEEVNLEKKAEKEWKEIFGQKEYPENEKWFLKRIYIIRNNLVFFKNFIFFKKENVRDIRTTLALMKEVLVQIFTLCKWGLYVISMILVWVAFTNGGNGLSDWAFAFCVWFLARAFRIAAFEIEKMKDEKLIISIFSGCISFVAMLIAIITLFVSL